MLGFGRQLDLGNPVSDHPLNRGLVSWLLPQSNNSGSSTLFDIVPTGRNNVPLTNGPTWTTGPGAFMSVLFDGTDDYGVMPNPGLSGSTPRTVDGFIRLDSTSGLRTMFRCGPNDVNALQSFGVFANVLAGGDLYILFSGCDWYTGAVLTAGRWHHVAVTYNGGAVETVGNVAAYLNGVPQSLTKIGVSTGAANTVETTFGIGTDPHNARYWLGAMTGLRFSSRALSASEVYSIYDQSIRNYPDLLRRVPTTTWISLAAPVVTGNRRRRVLICGGN